MTNENSRLQGLRDLQFTLMRLVITSQIDPADAIAIGSTIEALMGSLTDGEPHAE
ncbi:hypothetical protein [Methylobacterium sp. J-092]|uniref:hypothetical protein n=1 Tax=Methylobacterium sp. J-092 TaxID=2836667 RepID=UPI001FB8DABC|nr:hypothetical protein [Methylobacterium sp. J-092]MCJ2006742.1 hypothetical protein [Methylobacterium sp. J-092]